MTISWLRRKPPPEKLEPLVLPVEEAMQDVVNQNFQPRKVRDATAMYEELESIREDFQQTCDYAAKLAGLYIDRYNQLQEKIKADLEHIEARSEELKRLRDSLPPKGGHYDPEMDKPSSVHIDSNASNVNGSGSKDLVPTNSQGSPSGKVGVRPIPINRRV